MEVTKPKTKNYFLSLWARQMVGVKKGGNVVNRKCRRGIVPKIRDHSGGVAKLTKKIKKGGRHEIKLAGCADGSALVAMTSLRNETRRKAHARLEKTIQRSTKEQKRLSGRCTRRG